MTLPYHNFRLQKYLPRYLPSIRIYMRMTHSQDIEWDFGKYHYLGAL